MTPIEIAKRRSLNKIFDFLDKKMEKLDKKIKIIAPREKHFSS